MNAENHPAAPHVATPAPAPHMLIVDDDPGAVQILARMLEGLGEMRFASSGGEALRLGRAQRPDLVLLDADMPGMSGFEVFHAMQVEPDLASVPVIFVTSHREPAFEVAALGLGAADFISKPLQAEQVLARMLARLHGTAAATLTAATARPPLSGPVLLLVDCDESVLHFERVAIGPTVGTVQFGHGAFRARWRRRPGTDGLRGARAGAGSGWIGVDAQGLVVVINAAASRLVGVDAQHAIGRPLPAWGGAQAQAGGNSHCQPPAAATWQIGDGASRVTVMRLQVPAAE